MRLIALEIEDLKTIAAACQDALFLASNVFYKHSSHSFTLEINRFKWENDNSNERVGALLSFSSVLGVKSIGVEPKSNIPKSILSIEFIPDNDPPSGTIVIELAGGGKFALKVECIDIILGDIGEAVKVKSRPNHDED